MNMKTSNLVLIMTTAVCYQAKICGHSGKERCGVEDGSVRRFLDSCDILEYNCLKGTNYEKTSKIRCRTLPPIYSQQEDENKMASKGQNKSFYQDKTQHSKNYKLDKTGIDGDIEINDDAVEGNVLINSVSEQDIVQGNLHINEDGVEGEVKIRPGAKENDYAPILDGEIVRGNVTTSHKIIGEAHEYNDGGVKGKVESPLDAKKKFEPSCQNTYNTQNPKSFKTKKFSVKSKAKVKKCSLKKLLKKQTVKGRWHMYDDDDRAESTVESSEAEYRHKRYKPKNGKDRDKHEYSPKKNKRKDCTKIQTEVESSAAEEKFNKYKPKRGKNRNQHKYAPKTYKDYDEEESSATEDRSIKYKPKKGNNRNKHKYGTKKYKDYDEVESDLESSTAEDRSIKYKPKKENNRNKNKYAPKKYNDINEDYNEDGYNKFNTINGFDRKKNKCAPKIYKGKNKNDDRVLVEVEYSGAEDSRFDTHKVRNRHYRHKFKFAPNRYSDKNENDDDELESEVESSNAEDGYDEYKPKNKHDKSKPNNVPKKDHSKPDQPNKIKKDKSQHDQDHQKPKNGKEGEYCSDIEPEELTEDVATESQNIQVDREITTEVTTESQNIQMDQKNTEVTTESQNIQVDQNPMVSVQLELEDVNKKVTEKETSKNFTTIPISKPKRKIKPDWHEDTNT